VSGAVHDRNAMTLPIKNSRDSNSPGKPGASTQNSENKPGQSPRSNPVCLELAITIRSLPTEAGGLTQPIREEGRTVIVFDNGAVLRSTNNLPIGQTVILSNPDGRDVVCRVVGGRNMPNIKGYVEVEFLEPVNDFWHIHEEAAPVVPALPPVVSLALREVNTAPSLVAPHDPAPSQTTVRPANVALGSGPTFEDVPGLLSSPVSTATREMKIEPARTGPEKISTEAPHYELSENAYPTSVANWSSPAADPPAEKHASPAAREDSAISSTAPARSHDFLSKGLMAYEQPHAASHPSSGKKPLMVGLSTLVLAFIGGVAFFMHRGAVRVSVPIPSVATQPPAAEPQPVNKVPVPARAQTEEASSATMQPQPLTQTSAQPAAAEQPRPIPAVAPVPAVATSPATTDIRIEAAPGPTNVRRPEKSTVAAKQPDPPASRRPAIPNLKLGSPNAPKQNLANSAEVAVPLTDISTSDAAGGSTPSALLASAGRISNPPAAPPSAPATAPVSAPRMLRDPEAISTTRPVYPANAKQANVQGTVTVSASIDENGNVVSAKAMNGPIMLRQAAADSVKQWKYSPRLIDGKPAPAQVTVAIDFKLK
jgi:protein TonB